MSDTGWWDTKRQLSEPGYCMAMNMTQIGGTEADIKEIFSKE
jgi:hypothetical protein